MAQFSSVSMLWYFYNIDQGNRYNYYIIINLSRLEIEIGFFCITIIIARVSVRLSVCPPVCPSTSPPVCPYLPLGFRHFCYYVLHNS